DEVATAVRALPQVRRVLTDELADGWRRFTVRVETGADLREEIAALIGRNAWPLREFVRRQASLEDVFVELTQNQ
ncbi:MAG: hypothetical protein ACKV19_18765, partial [Verrucomicrobiales bacterium]